MLLNIIEEYNVNLLSTKIYWDKPKDRETYKKFWEEYKKIVEIKDEKKRDLKKEILFLTVGSGFAKKILTLPFYQSDTLTDF